MALDDIKPRDKTNSRKGKKVNREHFSTHTGHALTSIETKFIDEYIKTGNATESAKVAGYKSTSYQGFAGIGQRTLNKPYIIEEINYRLEKAKDESIADATEIMQYFTDVMRGKVTDQFGLEASLSERTKAAQELAKRQIDIPQKLQGNEAPKLTITVDWGEDASANVDVMGESVDTASIQKAFDCKPQIKDEE